MRSLRAAIIKSIVCGIVLIGALFLFAQLAFGQTQNQATNQNLDRQLYLQGPLAAEPFAQHMDYYLDPKGDLTIENIIDISESGFKPVTTSTPHFGFTKDTIWLRSHIKNLTQGEDSWVVHVHENFLPD